MAPYPDQSPMGGMGLGGMGMPQGTPPIIPGLTQLSPERMQAVMQSQGQGPPMEQEEALEDARNQLPRLIAAQFSLIQQAAELGPDAFELLSTMATTAIKQFKKQLGIQAPGMMAAPPMYGGAPPPMMGPSVSMSPGVSGENPAAPFLSLLAAGGR